APLRQLGRVVPRESVHLFKPRDAYRADWGGGSFGGGTDVHPVGKNPPSGAMIYYWLKSKNQDVRLDILDAAGRLIRSFTSRQDVGRAVRAQGRSPFQGDAGGVAGAVRVPAAAGRDLQRGHHCSHDDSERACAAGGPVERRARVRFGAVGRAGTDADRPAGGDRRRAVPGPQPVVPGTAQLPPKARRVNQRAWLRRGGDRRDHDRAVASRFLAVLTTSRS